VYGVRPAESAPSSLARDRTVTPSKTHLVLIPSYNPGTKALETVQAARAEWDPVWVVVDGSTDGSAEKLCALARTDPGLRVLVRERNGGKGAALLDGLIAAQRAGFTHALTMDADGQHPAERIGAFMSASTAAPGAMILGDPVFDTSAPRVRLRGRRIANWCTNLETLWAGVHDTLFGYRVYPIAPLRFRSRGGGAAQLARRAARQSAGTRALFQRRGRRRLTLQLLARQRAADVHVSAAERGLSRAPAMAWGKAARPRGQRRKLSAAECMPAEYPRSQTASVVSPAYFFLRR